MRNFNQLVVLALIASLVLFSIPFFASAQDGWDEEEVVIYLKKIRDTESNYLRDVTKATARAVSQGGEFKAMPHKRNATGPVLEVTPPAFTYAPYEDGMNTKELASAGLSLVSDVGDLFGFGDEANKVNDMNARLNEKNNAILDAWGENEKVMVTMTSSVLLLDDKQGVEISRAINYEKVFNSKSEFLAQKDALVEEAVVGEVKKVLVEYVEDDTGF